MKPFPFDDLPPRLAALIAIHPGGGCWLWQGADSGSGRGGGYGRVKWRGVTQAVHRVVWQIAGGRVLRKGEQLDHECRARRCCNPAHLRPMFQPRNMKLAHARRRADFVAEAVR
ncbi:HNH endonuclease [Ancylobacter sp. FA202]|uniref:HNH endonuclease n=1 Tax=Ancylobacter sp. FA202 TaxID=1111106 RepID=UPI000363C670|nr:HNH endonuclease [Ancylobacter sp. FA202]